MAALAVDAWAFIEAARHGPRRSEVETAFMEADGLVTVREVVVETFNFLVARTRRTDAGWAWWKTLRASHVSIEEIPLADLAAFADRPANRTGGLSLTDLALAALADREGIRDIATADAGFRILGFRPLFATR